MRSKTHFATALAAVMIIGTARVCFAVACGDTITSDETLTADLNCATNPALTIGVDGSLDMNAFEVTCNGTARGIVLAADGTSVKNGSVGNCSQYGILLDGSKHTVSGMYVFNSNTGIYVSDPAGATGIKIKDSAVAGVVVGITFGVHHSSISGVSVNSSSTGLAVEGSGNKIKDVTIHDSSFTGVIVYDDETKLSNVRVAGTGTGVISSFNSTSNKYSNVHSLNHTANGIELRGTGNTVIGSTVIGANSSNGIVISDGQEHTISKCATLAGSLGIRPAGTACVIKKNRVFGSTGNGIFADSSNCEIANNVGLGNAIYDFNDNSAGCMNGNVWSKNFGKKGQSCIE